MGRARMYLSVWLLALPACSVLFAADGKQCERASDCKALGGQELVCQGGLCLQMTGNSAQIPKNRDAGGAGGDQTPSDAGTATTHDAAAAPMDGGSESDGSDSDVPSAPDSGSDAGMQSDAGHALPDAGMGVRKECPTDDAQLRFCDGFENGLTAWTTTAQEDGATLSVVSTPVACGAQALESTLAMTGKGKASLSASFADVSSGPLWGRAFLWADGAVQYEILSVFRINTGVAPDEGIDVSFQQGAARAVLYYNARGIQYSSADLQLFPTGRWACVELGFVPADTGETGVASLYVDGRLAVTLQVLKPSMPFNVVQAGIFYRGPNQVPVSTYLDAVAVSGTRIGCQ